VQQQRFCPNCGTQIESGQKHCSNCGATFCPICSTLIPQGGTKCPRCNYLLGSSPPGMVEHRPLTPPPSPRPFSASQGGIIGPQPIQPPSYPPTPSAPTPSAIPGTPIQQPMPPQQYGTGGQPPGVSDSPGAMPYVSAQEPSVSTRKTFVDTAPIRVRRFPPALVAILIIAVIGLLGFSAFAAGWLESPLNAIQEFAVGIQWPNWLPIGPKDTTPPAISEVNVSNITETNAVITWQTDEPSTSQVMVCDPEGGCTWTEVDENLVTDHSVTISNLKLSTTYHFTATSTDAKENQAISEGDFTTLAQATTTPPAISGIKASNITDISATISWTTDKAATSQVEYGTTNAYGSTTTLDQQLTTSHSTTLAGLIPSTTYHFKVKSKDASGTEAAFQDQTFTTRSTVSAAAEVGPEVGKRAPDFTLQDLDGKAVSLSEFRGKTVMLKFWTDSQTSRNEMPVIQAFYEKWTGEELILLAINWKQPPAQVQSFVEDKGLTFPVLLDQEGEVASKYKVSPSSNPSTFFIDAQGIIKLRQDVPFKTDMQIESKLESLQSSP